MEGLTERDFRYLVRRIRRLERLMQAAFEGRNLNMWSVHVADDLGELGGQTSRDGARVGAALERIERDKS